jgi:hypothetical protein
MSICTRSLELISVGRTPATAYGNQANIVNIGARDVFRTSGVEGSMCNLLKDGNKIDMYGNKETIYETIPIERETINREETGIKSRQKGLKA